MEQISCIHSGGVHRLDEEIQKIGRGKDAARFPGLTKQMRMIISNQALKISKWVDAPVLKTLDGFYLSYQDYYQIEVLTYKGVGRTLLRKWPELKSNLEGPAVIVLSVLSFAPFSFNKRVVRKALISVLMLAVVVFLMILVAIQTGAIPFPG